MSENNNFTAYKEFFITKMTQHPDLVQALANNKLNFLDSRIEIDPLSLPYKNIFPYVKKQETLKNPDNLLLMKFDRFKIKNNQFHNGNITFIILCRDESVETDYGLRYDLIFEYLKELFMGDHNIGIGGLELVDFGDITPVKDYSGSYCTFHVVDFTE